MKRGFYTIMAAQFFSSLADNALLVTAIGLLKQTQAPNWYIPLLTPMFAAFYVLLAPFLGAFADALPKGRVMFISNAVKIIGCLLMLVGVSPLVAYAVVGLGAAAYSPAKYGILTELLPASDLVKANGWIEGLTIASIILGLLLGGQLLAPALAGPMLALDFPWINTGIDTAPETAIASLVCFYALAAWFNLRIVNTGVVLQPISRNLGILFGDFVRCNRQLWRDKLGQISLACTTLFWGVSGNMRVIVFAWAAVALGYDTTKASSLVGVVAIGTAIGAVIASVQVKLDKSVNLILLGAGMGVLVLCLNWIDNIWIAIPFLILLGGLGGFLVVPMNALLQHRGHNLMGAGRSIAVQNFNEQACILALGGLYATAQSGGLTTFTIISLFGLLIIAVMGAIEYWHRYNLKHTPQEVQRLLEIARNDKLHG